MTRLLERATRRIHIINPQLLRLWRLLGKKRRVQLGIAFFLMLISSISEVISLTAVIPFLALLGNPKVFWQQPLVQTFGAGFVKSNDNGLLLVTLVFSTTVLLAGLVRTITVWFNGRLASSIGSDLSYEAYRSTLFKPYSSHITNNSSVLIASISSDIPAIIGCVLYPLLQLLGSSLIFVGIAAALVFIDWKIALFASSFTLLFYIITARLIHRPMRYISKQQVTLNRNLIKNLQKGLGGIRNIILDNLQSEFLRNYNKVDRELRSSQALSGFLTGYPRIALETIGICSISVLGAYIAINDGNDRALALLGVFALGIQKILPLAQKIYEGWSMSRAASGNLNNILELIDHPASHELHTGKASPPLQLVSNISLQSVRFRYNDDGPWVLDGLNLQIARGERIGIIGKTGSGKSTLLDILMGLLSPTEGSLLIDEREIKTLESLISWRSSIAHVPQVTFLTDNSIAENIAFGLPKSLIDMDRVISAATMAGIGNFIESTPESYDTKVGERGIKLSGGQLQRISIARALYQRAQVLFLDEATSALDDTTEELVMDAIMEISRDITIIIVAHRLSSLSRCDRIVELESCRYKPID